MQKTLNVAQCNVLGLAQWGEGFIDLLAKLALHFCFCFVFFVLFFFLMNKNTKNLGNFLTFDSMETIAALTCFCCPYC